MKYEQIFRNDVWVEYHYFGLRMLGTIIATHLH